MWKRNLFFFAVCLLALTALGGSLFRQEHLPTPASWAEVAQPDADFLAAVQEIDQQFQADWEARGLQPAPPADELTFMRRVSLGLTGTVPSLEEIRAVESLPKDQRRAWWLAHLLEDRRFSDYLAERLARAYVGTENGPFLIYRRRRFATWLSDQVQQRRPYDQIVHDLLSDSGLWTDSPAVNFVTATVDQNNGGKPDPIRLAGRTSRAFLGMRIDCLQCHDDRLGNIQLGSAEDPREGTQEDFHKLAAFFSEARTSLLGVSDQPQTGYRYKFLMADEETLVPPAVPFARDMLEAGGTRRERLARWVTDDHNRPFARATVNRLWAVLFGKPLVEPIDDIPLHGTYPPGLERLADDFIAHGYDLHRTLRLIAATRVFQLDSRTEGDLTEAHEVYWAVFPLTRLRPEQMAGSVIQAASLQTIDAHSHIFAKLIRFFQAQEFVRRYGDMGEDEFADRGGTVTQRLIMMNGKLVKERTQNNPVLNATTRIARLCPTDESAVEAAYLTALTRRPTEDEQRHFVQRLSGTRGDERGNCLEDLFWVLFNSSEFSWNH